MSQCELVNVEGFSSRLNLIRLELPDSEIAGLKVGQFVKDTTTNRIGKIYRHCQSHGMHKVDLKYWRSPRSPFITLLKMVAAFELEPIKKPESDLICMRKLERLPRVGM